MADFLQNMQQSEQKLLIDKCINHLNPKGAFIIRTGSKAINPKDKSPSYFLGQLVQDAAIANNAGCTIIDQGKDTSNIIFVINKNG